MTIWDTTSAAGGSGSGASWSSTDAGGGYEIQSTLVPAGFIGSNIQKVWFYLKTNVTSSATDPIRAYIIDSSGTTRDTSTNSVSRSVLTTSFVLHEFTFGGTTAINNTDNIVVGFTGASGSGAMQFDAQSGDTAVRTFAGFSPSTLYGTWSGKYRWKVEYSGSSPPPGGSTVTIPPPVAMVRI